MKVYRANIKVKENALNPHNCSHIVNSASNLAVYEGKIKYNGKEVDIQSILGLLSLAPLEFEADVQVTIATIEGLNREEAIGLFADLEIGEVTNVYRVI